MILSHRHRFLFVKTRKTGGTSVELALSSCLGPDDVATRIDPRDEELRRALGIFPRNEQPRPPGLFPRLKSTLGRGPRFYNHIPASEVRRLVLRRQWEGYFKFTVERSPWDLCRSAHAWDVRQRARKGLPTRSFSTFLHSDDLLLYSNWPLYADSSGVIVDEVIRYENLHEGLSRVADRIGISLGELPRAKAGIRTDFRPPEEVYGRAERARVEAVFHRELRHFGWSWVEPSPTPHPHE